MRCHLPRCSQESTRWARYRRPTADANYLRRPSQVRPLIARLLADEYWFGNNPPGWPGAPTADDAKKARKRCIKRLKRFSPQFPEAAKLAKILARCKRRRRCMSGACPECGRAFQRCFVAEVKEPGEQARVEQTLASPQHRVSQTPNGGRPAQTSLNTTKHEAVPVRDHQGRRRSRWMAGGIDLSLNDDTQKNHGVGWQPQFYGFADVTNREALSKVLRDTYSPTKIAPQAGPDQRMRRLREGNFLCLQDRFCPAYRLPKRSWST